jgi:hypothetical protein
LHLSCILQDIFYRPLARSPASAKGNAAIEALSLKEGVRAMRRGLSLFGLLFALLMLLLPSALQAQVGGTISGYVQDQGGGAIRAPR